MMKPEISQSYFLSAGEVNAESEIALPLLASKIIDIATAHANSLGIGNPDMPGPTCGWVLSRLTIEMERYPRVNETYALSTWIESLNRRFSDRAFAIMDAEGRALGYARSVWMVLDTATHESIDLSQFRLPDEMISGKECPIARPRRIRETEPNRPTVSYTFQYCDLDFYRHVNTVRYISLLLNRFSLEELDATTVGRIELSFMREGRYGQTVEIQRRDEGMASHFRLTDAADGSPLLEASIYRRQR